MLSFVISGVDAAKLGAARASVRSAAEGTRFCSYHGVDLARLTR